MDDTQMMPFAAYEAQQERHVRAIKYMSLGWVISVVMLVFLLIISISYEVETVEEVTTTTTTNSDVAQESGDNGTNHYIGGDYYGNADSSSNNDDD